MLERSPIIAFSATARPDAARAFYADVLGLRLVEEHEFAMVFDAAGTMLRLQKAAAVKPASYTLLGWRVTDIQQTVAGLAARGVAFKRYGFMDQDEAGVWSAPDGAKVAWFEDPDGNVLSLTQF